MHAKHLFARLSALMLAVLMLVSVAPAVFAAEAPAKEQNTQQTADKAENDANAAQNDDEEIVTQVDKNSFVNYLKKIADKKFASATVSVSLLSAKLTGNAAVTSYQGKDAVKLQEGDSVTVTVDIPEDGVYFMDLEYCPVKYKGQDIETRLKIDGKLPFSDAKSIELMRTFRDKTKILQDGNGNDDIPEMEEVFQWKTVPLKDYVNFVNEDYRLYLTKGTHTVTLKVEREAVALTTLTFCPRTPLKSYADLKKEYDAKGYKPAQKKGDMKPVTYIQAETPAFKTDSSLIPLYDRTSPATVPYDPSKIRRNTIGQDAWNTMGQALTYRFMVPADGLYEIGIKYRQCYAVGSFTNRDIYIDGEIPCMEFKSVPFNYENEWQYKVVSDQKGNACPIYLTAGEHTITLEVCLGEWSGVMQEVDIINRKLSSLYRHISMVTGASPDPFRDYKLEVEIPGLLDDMKEIADALSKQTAAVDALYSKQGDKKSASAELLRSGAKMLYTCIKKPKEIQYRLGALRDSVSSVSTWLNDCKKQPLELDYVTVVMPGEKHPSPKATWFQNFKHFFLSFFASFTEDYNTVSNTDAKDAIKIWVGEGREQMQALKGLINSSFTVETGIPVKLSLTQGGLYEALLAGVGPDLAIGQARITPVNYASRGIAVPLDDFDTFDEVKKRFAPNALDCYKMGGKTYALPVTQNFWMLFYRKDIFQEMNLEVPTTWDEFIDVTKTLQSNNMTVRLPYSAITLAGVESNGIGMKDMFATFFLQRGGKLYSDDMSETLIGSQAGLDAFKFWTDFYKEIGLEVELDFQSRMRTGETPMGIENINFFNTLSAVASEIRGLWDMAPVPGTRKPDGSIDFTSADSGSACLIFNTKQNKNRENCWKFLDWYTRQDTQYEYGSQIENMLGIASRYYPANLEAFERLPWTQDQLKVMETQRSRCVVIPEVPGAYYFPRSIDSAFRDVQNKNANPREVWLREVKNINKEIDRKNRELHTGKYAKDQDKKEGK